MHTKDKSVQYKANIVTRRNDPRLNNHQKIQLEGWRANCDIQVILDYHACIEYLCKYAAKGEPRSNMLKNTFNSVVHNLNSCRDPLKAMKKIMIKRFYCTGDDAPTTFIKMIQFIISRFTSELKWISFC